MQPAASIFKAYDIRGVVDETLTDEVVTLIGAALGLLIQRAGKSECVVVASDHVFSAIVLDHRQASHFAAPVDNRRIEQAALFEIDHQCGGTPVHIAARSG